MSKKVLAIYYTQSGQMREIISAFTAPVAAAAGTIERVEVKPVEPFSFPWTGSSFFSVMPDCVLGVARPIEELVFKETKYDLIVLGYQPWFLSPSIPCSSLLQTQAFRDLLKDTPVVTISEARNMWINGYLRVRQAIKDAGGNLVGNVALVDRHSNPVSFVTIFYWMLTAKKEKYLNLFPKPGVDEQDITGSAKFGDTIARHLMSNNWDGMQDELLAQQAVKIKYPLMLIESRAKPIFRIWAGVISKKKNKGPWVSAFKYYLFGALFIAAPILLTFDAIFMRPFLTKRTRAKKLSYMQVN
jgi:hypothetical protein